MTNPKNHRIDSASRVIAASPKAIYDAFMNPEVLVFWLPPKGMSAHINEFNGREGGAYRMTLTYESDYSGKSSETTDVSEGKFLALVPGTKIVLSVNFDAKDPTFNGEMIQSWFLEAVPEGTKVTIICENVPPGIKKEDHDIGLNSTLENLASFIEIDH